MWIYLGIVSALFLGLYDVCRKHALRDNHVIGVLAVSTASSLVLIGPMVLLSRIAPGWMTRLGVFVPEACWLAHALLAAKSVIVCGSWVLSYYSFKHLPVSIAGPIGATAPVWTLIGAVWFFNERLTPIQYTGFMIMGISYLWLSAIGDKEGISMHKNKWVLCMLVASLLAAFSGLYDKYLVNVLGYHPLQVQANQEGFGVHPLEGEA